MKKIALLIIIGLLIITPAYAKFTVQIKGLDNIGVGNSVSEIKDADEDTKIEVERTSDDDTIYLSTAGSDRVTIDSSGDVVMTGDLSIIGELEVDTISGSGDNMVLSEDSGFIGNSLTTTGGENTINFVDVDSTGALTGNAIGEDAQIAVDGTSLIDLSSTGVTFNTGVVIKRTEVDDADYTVLNTDYLVAYTALTADRTVTLPTSNVRTGQMFVIKDEAGKALTSDVILDPSGSLKIDGDLTTTLSQNYGKVKVYWNGTQYYTTD